MYDTTEMFSFQTVDRKQIILNRLMKYLVMLACLLQRSQQPQGMVLWNINKNLWYVTYFRDLN
jgi:hypothetical protein